MTNRNENLGEDIKEGMRSVEEDTNYVANKAAHAAEDGAEKVKHAASDTKNAAERGLGADLDQDGTVGR